MLKYLPFDQNISAIEIVHINSNYSLSFKNIWLDLIQIQVEISAAMRTGITTPKVSDSARGWNISTSQIDYNMAWFGIIKWKWNQVPPLSSEKMQHMDTSTTLQTCLVASISLNQVCYVQFFFVSNCLVTCKHCWACMIRFLKHFTACITGICRIGSFSEPGPSDALEHTWVVVAVHVCTWFVVIT